jgi:hypothetical protein
VSVPSSNIKVGDGLCETVNINMPLKASTSPLYFLISMTPTTCENFFVLLHVYTKFITLSVKFALFMLRKQD